MKWKWSRISWLGLGLKPTLIEAHIVSLTLKGTNSNPSPKTRRNSNVNTKKSNNLSAPSPKQAETLSQTFKQEKILTVNLKHLLLPYKPVVQKCSENGSESCG